MVYICDVFIVHDNQINVSVGVDTKGRMDGGFFDSFANVLFHSITTCQFGHIDYEKYPICRNGRRYKKDSGNTCTRSQQDERKKNYTESEVKDKQVKRGLMDIDVGECDKDSDMSPSKKLRLQSPPIGN